MSRGSILFNLESAVTIWYRYSWERGLQFVDLLGDLKQKYWQVLPVAPPSWR